MALAPTVDDLASVAAKSGAPAAIDALLRAIEQDVQRYCRKKLPNLQDAEEAAQDTLLQVARKITSFRAAGPFRSWLYAVAFNSIMGTYRDLKRRSKERNHTEYDPQLVDPRTTSVIAGTHIDLLDAFESLQSERPALYPTLILREQCDMEYAEIAKLLGISEKTVSSRLIEGRKYVRRKLTDDPPR